jgi:hypothetical protein
MNDIDALTLRLLSSKKKYNTYLSTVDPDKAAANETYKSNVAKYESRIKSLLSSYFKDPETQTTNEVDESIEACFKSLIKHFEIQDREEKQAKNDYDEKDDETDTMFEQ